MMRRPLQWGRQLLEKWWRFRSIAAIDRVQRVRDGTQNEYNEDPVFTLVLQFFNKRHAIPSLLKGMRASGAEEVIVLEDGSSDDSLPAWASVLTRKNDFLVRSNDLFEVRTYERARRFASGEFVVLLQDDDPLPDDSRWLQAALGHFRRQPTLAILGGRDGLELAGAPAFRSGGSHQHITRGRSLSEYTDLRAVMCVNRAPMIVRRSAFAALGGIDQAYAPFQCDDADLCLTAWSKGWAVGLYNPAWPRLGRTEGGMRLFNRDIVSFQAKKNWAMLYDRWDDQLADIRHRVHRAAETISEQLAP